MAYAYSNSLENYRNATSGATNQQGYSSDPGGLSGQIKTSEVEPAYQGYLQQSKIVDRRPSFREFIEPEIRYHRRLADELERLLKNFQPVICTN